MTNPIRILVVEDDPYLGMMVEELLKTRGYEAHLCTNGKAGYEQFISLAPHLCLLDINLPAEDGFSLAKRIKQAKPAQLIVFLTAKSLKEDVIAGFQLGADDYIKKPFSMEELLLRIQAIFRRTGMVSAEESPTNTPYQIGKYIFDLQRRQLQFNSEEANTLPQREADLLGLLCEAKNQLLAREYALKKLWGDDSYFNARSMDVYISNLRKRLKQDSNIQIVNIRGRGFKLLLEEGEGW